MFSTIWSKAAFSNFLPSSCFKSTIIQFVIGRKSISWHKTKKTLHEKIGEHYKVQFKNETRGSAFGKRSVLTWIEKIEIKYVPLFPTK